jgi:small ligand-binding sensory domain FIST
MRFASAGNQTHNTKQAVREAVASIQKQLHGKTPDLAFVFVSPHHTTDPGFGRMLYDAFQSRVLVGCTAESVSANGYEYENGPAIALWAATLPRCGVDAFHIAFERTLDGLLATGAPSADIVAPGSRAAFLLGDPFSCSVDSLLAHFSTEFPGLPVMGGMASGASAPGENRLFLNDGEYDHGSVGVVIGGPVSIRSVVSQGCRPIGKPFVVTRANRNMLVELGGRPALEQLNTLYRDSVAADQELIKRGVHVGLAMSEYKESFQRGDFLIANVIGADRESGALALGNLIRTGQTMQFHVRDAGTADEDLRSLLASSLASGPAAGGLLFSCNGRGTRMFPSPHHDANVIQDVAGSIPLAGFFAQGELGPVAGQNYIHGFTASVALFGVG